MSIVNIYHPKINVVVQIESLAALETECGRILDLRECLRVEEITVDIWTDMEEMYRDPPNFVRFQNRLKDIRIAIIRMCQSLSYIEDECVMQDLWIDITAIDQRRIAQRPPDHPYNIIAPYLRQGVEWFNDYDAFDDPSQINGGPEIKMQEGSSIRDTPKGSGSTTSSEESLKSEYSFLLGYHRDDELSSKGDEVAYDLEPMAYPWTGISSEFINTELGRPFVVV